MVFLFNSLITAQFTHNSKAEQETEGSETLKSHPNLLGITIVNINIIAYKRFNSAKPQKFIEMKHF